MCLSLTPVGVGPVQVGEVSQINQCYVNEDSDKENV